MLFIHPPKVYSIYRATNTINGKVYIGFDSNWPKRKSEHKTVSKHAQFKFYNAIRKHGWDNFVWDIIYQSLDHDHCLDVMEQYFIDQYDSICNGYNSTRGGAGGASGANWWNNGITQLFTQTPPDDTFVKGRLYYNNKGSQIGADIQRGKIWINDGTNEMMVLPSAPLPAGYVVGRLAKAFANGSGRHNAKDSKWWNNGTNQVMSIDCPGSTWVRGRIRGSGSISRNPIRRHQLIAETENLW